MSDILEKYEKFGLRANPFSDERFDMPMVDRQSDWTKIKNVLLELLVGQSAGIVVLFGDYGMGKSYTLSKISDFLQGAKRGGPSPSSILAAKVRASEPELPRHYSVDLFIRLIKSIGRPKLLEIFSKASEAGENFESPYDRIVPELAHGNDLAWNWVSGKKLSKGELRSVGASTQVSDSMEIHDVFFGALRVFKAAGIDSIVILLDELEFLLSQAGRSKLLTIIHEVQAVWDDYNQMDPGQKTRHAKVIFVFASSPDAWQKFLELAEQEKEKKGGGGTESFLRRIPENARLDLSPLKKADVKEFLEARISDYRTKPMEDPLFPFKSDYVDLISRLSFGIPSKILALSALVIREAAQSRAPIKHVDSHFAETVLKDTGALIEFGEEQK